MYHVGQPEKKKSKPAWGPAVPHSDDESTVEGGADFLPFSVGGSSSHVEKSQGASECEAENSSVKHTDELHCQDLEGLLSQDW